MNFQMFKLVLQKAEEPEIKLPISAGSSKKQGSSRKNIYFCFIDYAKAFDCVCHNKLWKLFYIMYIFTPATTHWNNDNIHILQLKSINTLSKFTKEKEELEIECRNLTPGLHTPNRMAHCVSTVKHSAWTNSAYQNTNVTYL